MPRKKKEETIDDIIDRIESDLETIRDKAVEDQDWEDDIDEEDIDEGRRYRRLLRRRR
jgi:hypothetical protein